MRWTDVEISPGPRRPDWWHEIVLRALAALLEDELPQDPLP